MTKEEILHLGELSRIRLTEGELEKYQTEISSILDYVGQVQEIVSDVKSVTATGPVFNIFREDQVTNEPGAYTKDLVEAFPERQDGLLRVKKILNPDS